jgi:D-alanyl-D-alanine dipeptidase
MGTPFDFFSPRSSPGDRSVGKEAWVNRHLLADAMKHRGFVPYEKEWWHFTLRAEPFRDTYFNFVVK